MAKTFNHGQIVMTRAISDRMQDNKFAVLFIILLSDI